MDLILSLVQIGVGLCTMALMAYTLWRMIALTAEARVARSIAVSATARAEKAATEAAAHAQDAKASIDAVASNVQKIELATNSMKDALIVATAAASHLEGREEMRGEAAAAAAAAAAEEKP